MAALEAYFSEHDVCHWAGAFRTARFLLAFLISGRLGLRAIRREPTRAGPRGGRVGRIGGGWRAWVS